MIDLRNAINCRNHIKERGNIHDYKIGIIKKKIPNGKPFVKREVILYSELNDTISISNPLSKEAIEQERRSGGKNLIQYTLHGVSPEYVEEIKID